MKIINLGEIAKIDISNVDKKIKDTDSPVVLCNFVDVYHNWAITDDLLPNLMKSTANENQISRFSIRKGQVAITKDSETRDDIGVSTYIADNISNGVLGYHCALITPDENILTGKYLNVVLHTPYAQKYFELNASGSGQRYTLTVDIIAGFPVPVPDIETQHIVGDFYSAIDKKLSTNNRINSELESMAKTIYDYWFTQFNFPDENGKPYRSSGGKMVWNEELKREIPEGWEVGVLSEETNIQLGGTPNTATEEYWNGDIHWLNSSELINSPIISSEKRITEKGKNESSTSFSKSGAVLISLVRYIRPAILGIDACYNQSVVAVEPNKRFHSSYIYSYLLSKVDYYMSIRTGAQQPHINKEIIEQSKIVIPNDIILDKYYNLVDNLFERQLVLAKENQQLSSLRDWLLPMLMNGQVGFEGE